MFVTSANDSLKIAIFLNQLRTKPLIILSGHLLWILASLNLSLNLLYMACRDRKLRMSSNAKILFQAIIISLASFNFWIGLINLSSSVCSTEFLVTTELECSLVNVPAVFSYMMLTLLLLAFSLERVYSSVMFWHWHRCVESGRIAVGGCVLATGCSAGLIVSKTAQASAEKWLACLALKSADSLGSAMAQTALLTLLSACAAALLLAEKAANERRLANFSWFAAGRRGCDLHARLQLAVSLETDRTVQPLALRFALSCCSAYALYLLAQCFDGRNELLRLLIVRLGTLLGQLFNLAAVGCLITSDAALRRAWRRIATLASRLGTRVHAMAHPKDQATVQYFNELNALWG